MKLYLKNLTTNESKELSPQDFKKVFDNLRYGVYDQEVLELDNMDDEGNLYFICVREDTF